MFALTANTNISDMQGSEHNSNRRNMSDGTFDKESGKICKLLNSGTYFTVDLLALCCAVARKNM